MFAWKEFKVGCEARVLGLFGRGGTNRFYRVNL